MHRARDPRPAEYVGTQRDAVLGFVLFFALGLGWDLPYILLASAAGAIRRLPRSGEWLSWVNRLFGTLLLGMALTSSRRCWTKGCCGSRCCSTWQPPDSRLPRALGAQHALVRARTPGLPGAVVVLLAVWVACRARRRARASAGNH